MAGLSGLTLDQLLAEYEATTDRLTLHLGELAQARANELDVRLETWFTTPAETAKHRDLVADSAARHHKRDVFVMQAHVDADRARIALLDHLITAVLL
jgi:hypothetical protein